MREHGDEFEKFEYGAGPAMRQQQRARIGPFAFDLEEVQIDLVQPHPVLGKGIEARLLRTPIEIVPPIADQAARPPHIGAVRPGRAGRLVRVRASRSRSPAISASGTLSRNFSAR